MTTLLLATVTVALPSPIQPLSPQPPLGGAAVTETEGIVHRVEAATRVAVRIDRGGRPFAVRAVQRLAVRDTGDYVFSIPAPVLSVRAARGSRSVPGQRRGFILWAGFNPQRKLLAADATLAPRRTRPFLPLRVEIRPRTITLVNVTRVGAGVFAADARAGPLARYLDRVRAAAAAGTAIPIGTAELTSTARPGRAAVEAPLRVTGTIGGRRVDTVLGDGRPLRLTVPRGTGRVAVAVRPAPPLQFLRPPAGAKLWADTRLTSRALLARTERALLQLARVRQYDSFLANPDSRGKVEAVFLYRSGRRPTPAVVADTERTSGWSAVTTALVAAAAVAALAVAVVVWARS
jgi:hypothetical protein